MEYFNGLSLTQRIGFVLCLIVAFALLAGAGPVGYVITISTAVIYVQLERIRKALK